MHNRLKVTFCLITLVITSQLNCASHAPYLLQQSHEVLLTTVAGLEENPLPGADEFLQNIYTKYYALFTQHANHRTLNQTQRSNLLLPFDVLFHAQDVHGTHIFRSPLMKSMIEFFSISAQSNSFLFKPHQLYMLTRNLKDTLLTHLQQTEVPSDLHEEYQSSVRLFSDSLYRHGLAPREWTWGEIAWSGFKITSAILTVVALALFIRKARELSPRETVEQCSKDFGEVVGEKTSAALNRLTTEMQTHIDRIFEKIDGIDPELLGKLAEFGKSGEQTVKTFEKILQNKDAINKFLEGIANQAERTAT